MKSNKIFKALSALFIFSVLVSSCKKDVEEPVFEKPTITGLEVGTDNNKIGHPGQDLHIEAIIVATAKIKEVHVEIHPEGGQTWSYNQTYTSGLAGTKNATFHEHIEIPATVELGEYHLDFTVIDEAGNSATVDSELELQPTSSGITAENFTVEYESAEDELHVEADITAPNQIAGITIEIHGDTYEDDFDVTGTANGQATYHLLQHLDLSAFPAGHYHVHLIIEDMIGNVMEFEEHFDK